MGVRLLVPEVSLSTSLLTELERNNDCLFAVAYLTREGVREISEVLNRRLDARSFSIRIVCCVSDLITDPEALEDLYDLGKRRKGNLKVRWHSQAGFHAKGYGFRKAGKTSVFIGSERTRFSHSPPASRPAILHRWSPATPLQNS